MSQVYHHHKTSQAQQVPTSARKHLQADALMPPDPRPRALHRPPPPDLLHGKTHARILHGLSHAEFHFILV